MLLPVLEELGKVIKAAEQRHGRVFHGELSVSVGDTATESGHADWGRSPSSQWASGDTALSQVEEPAGAEQLSSIEAFPPWRGSTTAVNTFPDGP